MLIFIDHPRFGVYKEQVAMNALMRKLSTIVALLALFALSARADFSTSYTPNTAIPDGSFTGVSDTHSISTSDNSILDVNVHLNVSGSWSGDLYVYLVHNSGFTVLLNRVGRSSSSAFGYGDAGVNVVFDDQAAQAQDIHRSHLVGGFNVTDGTTHWRPDGRNIDPASSGATFDAATPTALLSSFNGINPNGSWTLFLADVSGGATHTLNTWSLDVTSFDTASVPEPGSFVEASLGVLFLGGILGVYRLKRVKAPLCPA